MPPLDRIADEMVRAHPFLAWLISFYGLAIWAFSMMLLMGKKRK